MSDNKELHYRRNAVSHFGSAIKWAITIIGLPLATVYFLVASIELTLAAAHWTVGWMRLFAS